MMRPTRFLAAALMAAALLCCGALAAEAAPAEKQIAVQLDGQNLTFTDAAPQVRDQRTFLPFRAVFEAMGATVSWSADAPDAVSASRDGTRVAMTLGSTTAVVERDGIRTQLQMDVAPFAEGGRTYVPVRFAAQAFGCAVGWDQEAYTAILVDTDKLVKAAGAGKSFARLGEYAAFSQRYTQGTWTVDMDMEGSMTFLGMELPMQVTAGGVVADGKKMELDMNMTMDLTTIAVLAQMNALQSGELDGGMSEEDKALFDALKTEGVDLSARADLEQGTIYMNMAGQAMAGSGMDPNTWYSMDMNAMMAQAGTNMTFAQLMEKAQDTGYEVLAKAFLSTMTPVSADGEGYGVSYADFAASAENLAYALSDEGFVKDGDRYTAFIDGGLEKLQLVLTEKNGKVTGYEMTMFMTASDQAGEMSMEMTATVAMDDSGRMSGNVSMDMNGLVGAQLDISGGYTQGGKAPQTQPPAGAAVVDMAQMLPGEELPLE